MVDVSFLLPTRKRFEGFRKSMESIKDNHACVYKYEVLIIMDDDDVDTIEQVKEYITKEHKLFITERKGYSGLHLYYNELCRHASGSLLWLWNDDSTMALPGWDAALKREIESDLCLRIDKRVFGLFVPTNNIPNNTFPIISREFYNILGHFSLSAHNDTYVDALMKRARCRYFLRRTYVYHDLEYRNQDDTYKKDTKPIVSGTVKRLQQILESKRFSDIVNKVRHVLGLPPEAPKAPPRAKSVQPPPPKKVKKAKKPSKRKKRRAKSRVIRRKRKRRK